MGYKKMLLIAFLLSLFVLQQTQVSARFSINNKDELQPSIVHKSGIPTQIYVTVAHLNDRTNEPERDTNGNIVKCDPGDTFWSCGEGGSGYPYGNENPVLISMEDYLRDVLPREMDVAHNTHTLASLQAQALAARSYADFRLRLFGEMDNSVNFQVFIPNAYELYDPSATEIIESAVTSTSGQYLSHNSQAIDAQFASDSINRTATCLNADFTQCHSYLLAVEDPISAWQLPQPECEAINNGNASVDDPATPINEIGKVWGMSQKGAIRWSKGNHCAAGGDLPWPVRWDDYRQILVHYYTGIDIVNDANGSKVAPDDRWNLLKYENIPDTMSPGQVTTDARVWLQNTSTQPWSDAVLGYQWIGPDDTSDWNVIPISNLSAGADENKSVEITAPATGRTYTTLRFDVKHNGVWLSEQGISWPDVQIPVQVEGTIVSTPTFTLTPTSPTAIASYTPTPAEGEWIKLGSWNVGCNTDIAFPAVTTNQFKFQMLSGGGWDNHISFYGYSSSGAAWLANGTWQEVNNQTFALDVGEWRETNIFGTAVVNQQRFSVGCNDGERMDVDVFYRTTYMPTPTLPPFPTVTVTSQPTPCSKSCFWKECAHVDSTISAKVSSLGRGVAFAINNFDRISEQATLLYRVRDEILNTSAEGQRYTDLYYTHSPEIASIMDTHTELAEQGLDVIDFLTPNLQALVDNQGGSAVISSAEIQQAQGFLNALSSYASSDLQEAILAEVNKTPLEELEGMTMDQAWAYLNGYQVGWLPPINDSNPYRTQQKSTIPIKFRITDIDGNFVNDESVTLQVLDAAGNVVVDPVQVSNNPNTGIKIQGNQYIHNLETKNLSSGTYILQIIYNASDGDLSETRSIILTSKK